MNEPKDAPYRTVMTYTKMMTKHDSITFLLAQDRSTKKYFVIVWDLPTQRRWSSEALQVKNVIADQIGPNPWWQAVTASDGIPKS
jgi:hypothetical protein